MLCFEKCYGCCGGRFQPSHVSLVRNVYPTAAGEEGPKSSNLSLLVFQAQSKPEELPKICNYLETKVKRDVYMNRPVYVRVSLQILNALIKDCNVHMSLFAKNVVNIVYDLLQAPDLEMLAQVTATDKFCLFAQYHDHAILDVDPDFRSTYESILQLYGKLCVYEHSDVVVQFRHRLSGLKAFNAVVTHPSFAPSHDAEVYLNIIYPGLVANILPPDDPEFTSGTVSRAANSAGLKSSASPSHGVLVSNAIADPMDRRKSMAPTEAPSNPDIVTADTELDRLAEIALAEIMRSVTAGSFWVTFVPMYRSLEQAHMLEEKPEEVIRVFQISTSNLHPQHRNLLVSAILHRLSGASINMSMSGPQTRPVAGVTSNNIKWTAPHLTTNAKATCVRMLTAIISIGGTTVGLTVLELLDSLTRHLYWVIYTLVAQDKGQLSGEDRKEVEYLEAALIECIGSLATNLYYPNQINDIIGFIINRLKLDGRTKVTQVDPNKQSAQEIVASGVPMSPTKLYSMEWNTEAYDQVTLTEVRKALLRCLHRVLRSNLQANMVYSNVISRDRNVSRSGSEINMGGDVFGGVKRAPVPEELVSPMLVFLLDQDPEIRVEFFYFLYYFLISEVGQDESTPTTSSISMFATPPPPAPTNGQNAAKRRRRFRIELNSALYHLAVAPFLAPCDFVVLFQTLVAKLKKYGEEDVIETLPMLFAVQEFYNQANPARPAQQRGFGNVFVEFLGVIGDLYATMRLPTYVSKVRDDRILAHQWEPRLDFTLENARRYLDISLPALESDMQPLLQPVTIPVSREVVLEGLSNDQVLHRVLGDDFVTRMQQDWIDAELPEHESLDGDSFLQTMKRVQQMDIPAPPPEDVGLPPRFQTLDHTLPREAFTPITGVGSLKSALAQPVTVEPSTLPSMVAPASSTSSIGYIPLDSPVNGEIIPLQVIKSVPQLITTAADGAESMALPPVSPISPVDGSYMLPLTIATRGSISESDALSLTPSASRSQRSMDKRRAMSNEAANLLNSIVGEVTPSAVVLGPTNAVKLQPTIKSTLPPPIVQMQIPNA